MKTPKIIFIAIVKLYTTGEAEAIITTNKHIYFVNIHLCSGIYCSVFTAIMVDNTGIIGDKITPK